MRILHYLNFHNGGITRYTGEVVGAMPVGLETHVICPPDTDLGKAECVVHPSLADLRGASGLGGRLAFLRSQIENPFKLLCCLKQLRPDIVHFGNINHLSYSYWGGRLKALGIPFVVTVHDVRREKPLISSRWEDMQLVSLYRAASALLVHSNAQRVELEEFTGIESDKVVIVPHGPYRYPISKSSCNIREDLGIPASVQVGLIFGGIRDDKGVDSLIAAVAELPDTHLIVAGRSASPLHRPVLFYRNLACSLGVASRIHFVESYIPDERVGDYFQAADWCGLVYSQSFTSQSGVLCSAVGFRTPLLAAGAPTLVETVRSFNIGIVAENNSAGVLAAAMRELAKISMKGSAGEFEKFEEECSWTRNAHITAETYRLILKLKNGDREECD